MVRTCQFTAKYKGNKVVALEWQLSLWLDSKKHAFTSEVMWQTSVCESKRCTADVNGHFCRSQQHLH